MTEWLNIQEFLKQSKTIKNRDYLYQLMLGKKINEEKNGEKVFRRGKVVKKDIAPKMVLNIHYKIEGKKKLVHKNLIVSDGEVSLGKS